MTTLSETLDSTRVIICVGSGGVGKTTVAAAVAVQAALDGKKTLVVTIDPARRLANSLGLETLGNVAAPVSAQRFARAGLEPKGELWAMMLDVKRTSDAMIQRYAPSKEQAERIFANRFYQTVSTVLAGSQEYMAMEKLYELHHDGGYDVVVLDTPPTAHALDFLDAPNRILDVFGSDALRWIATPAVAAGRIGVKAFGLGGSYLVKQISKFTGLETLQALAEFLLSMRGMYDGFKERASKVKALLSSPDSTFVLVTAPGIMTMDEARFFYQTLRRNEMPVGAVVVNRAHPDWRRCTGQEVDRAVLEAEYDHFLAERLVHTIDEQQTLADADRQAIETLGETLEPSTILRSVPVFRRDVHDLAGLHLMSRMLFRDEPAVPVVPMPEH